MDHNIFQTAIKFGQLIKLITPLAGTRKALSKPLSRLLSGVQHRVSIIVNVEGGPDVNDASAWLDANYPVMLEQVKKSLSAEKMLNASLRKGAVFFHQVSMTGKSEKELSETIVRLGNESLTRVYIDHDKDAQSRHLYGSLVRNANWMPLIADLGTALSMSDKTQLNGKLTERNASYQGIMLYPERLKQLGVVIETMNAPKKAAGATGRRASTSKRATMNAPTIDSAGLYSVQVALDLDRILADPVVAPLIMNYPEAEGDTALAEILESAAKPVVLAPEASAESVAQTLVADLVRALHQRARRIDDLRQVRRVMMAKKKEQEAVEALRKIDPALLQALKNNPELLKTV